MSNKLFDEIERRTRNVMNRRTEQLNRFHIGDVVYPLYQSWKPILWGKVVEVNVTTNKITVNIHGIERQYDPWELVLNDPEMKPVNGYNDERESDIESIAKKVASAFSMNRSKRSAKVKASQMGLLDDF